MMMHCIYDFMWNFIPGFINRSPARHQFCTLFRFFFVCLFFFTLAQHLQWSAAEQKKTFLVDSFLQDCDCSSLLYFIYLFEVLKHFTCVFHCNSDKYNMVQRTVFTSANTVNAHIPSILERLKHVCWFLLLLKRGFIVREEMCCVQMQPEHITHDPYFLKIKI